MIELGVQQIAAATGGRVVCGKPAGFAHAAATDSRLAGDGSLFFGIPGARVDGGSFAPAVLAAGAWGVVVAPRHVDQACAAAAADQAVIEAADPVRALGDLALHWRRELGARVVAITGSTGKTSTKDILAALLAHGHVVVASSGNLNTQIGLPLTILGAPRGTDLLVLEMAMRARGEIAELVRIAEPDVGCVLNVGPVHLQTLGSVEQVAAAKAELIAGLEAGKAVVVPADEPLLAGHLRPDLRTLKFGPGGDVELEEIAGSSVTIRTPEGLTTLQPSFSEAHQVNNLLAAVACCVALGELPQGELMVSFSGLRGELIELPSGLTMINDCYNANPISMRAAIDNLTEHTGSAGRRLAVLGPMAELGRLSDDFHFQIGEYAAANGVDLLIAVTDGAQRLIDGFAGDAYRAEGPLDAARLLGQLAQPGDVALIKGSRSVGLEAIAAKLMEAGG